MIRHIEGDDAEAVATIARRGRVEAIPGFPDLHSPAEDLEFYRSEIATKSGDAFVDERGAVLGFILWHGEWIDHIYVHPEHERSKIGTQLLHRALAELAVPEVRLWTFQANARAVAFYAKHGFSVVAQTEGAANEEGLPDFLLVRSAPD